MRILTDDGVGLEVTDLGSGPALMLVHGFGGAKEDFSDQLADLATDHRVITLDLRGHGESDGPEEEAKYFLDRFAAEDRKSTRLNSSHGKLSRMPSSA